MNLRLNNEFLYQIFALLRAVIVVHGIYIGVIRPTADAQLAVQAICNHTIDSCSFRICEGAVRY